MNTELLDKLLRKRKILEKISDLSFEYSLVNRRLPLKKINDQEAEFVLQKYDEFLGKVSQLAKAIQNENENHKN